MPAYDGTGPFEGMGRGMGCCYTLGCDELIDYKTIILAYDLDNDGRIGTTDYQTAIYDREQGRLTEEVFEAIKQAWTLDCDLTAWASKGTSKAGIIFAGVLTAGIIAIALHKKY